MKTYLITGCAGFIGSNFVHYMLKKYPEILLVNLDKLTYAGNLENLKDVEGDPRHVFVQGDICDKELVEGLFQKYDFDYVINFAAESHVDRSIKNPEIFVQSNVMGGFVGCCASAAARREIRPGGAMFCGMDACSFKRIEFFLSIPQPAPKR